MKGWGAGAERGGAEERGGAAVEFVLVAPLLITMFLFIFGLGRLATAREAVDGAARDGAREASIARSAAEADSTANEIVAQTLVDKKVSCSNRQVTVDTGDFRPNGTVTVHVACTVANSDIIMSGLPGSSTLHSDFVAWVDKYRGTR